MRDLAAGALLAAVFGIALWVEPAHAEQPRRALLLAAGLASALALIGRSGSIPRWAWVLFIADLLWHAVAASLSLDPPRAWLGAPERGLGALDALAWWLIALGFAAADARARRRVAAVALSLTGILALLAVIEFYADTSQRPGATLGNPAYLGGLLAVCVPLALWAPLPRTLRWIVCALLLGALYLTGARGAWIAAAGGAAIALWLAKPLALATPRRLALIAAVGVLAVSAAVSRVDRPDSVAIRVSLYQAAVAPPGAPLLRSDGRVDPLAAWRPWIGYGLESIEPVLTRRRDADLNRYEARGWDRLADRTHNRLLDRWIALGWPGVLLGLALASLPLVGLLRADADSRRRHAVAAGAWVAFGIDGLFGVPHAAIDLAGALALGALLNAGPGSCAVAAGRTGFRLALGAVACLAVALSWRSLQPAAPTLAQLAARPSYSALPGLMVLEQLYQDDHALARAHSRRPECLRLAEHVSAAAPTLPRAWHLLAWMRAAHNDPEGADQAWQRALALLDLAQADSPLALAAARARLADRVHGEDPDAAQQLLGRAALELEALPPAQRDVHWQRSYAYISARRGRIADAIRAYEAALQLDPTDAASRANLQALRAEGPDQPD